MCKGFRRGLFRGSDRILWGRKRVSELAIGFFCSNQIRFIGLAIILKLLVEDPDPQYHHLNESLKSGRTLNSPKNLGPKPLAV